MTFRNLTVRRNVTSVDRRFIADTMVAVNYCKGEIFLISFCILLICECSEVPRPRGVSISRSPLYAPGSNFTCFDGSLTIPFSQVNDDYCDCYDGSDEPGTSACLNGIFHCTNAGHKPQNIPSSRVNDGICDCCDAADEYAHPTANCVNNCNEMGREARLEAQRKTELLKAGSQLRAEIIQKGGVMKNEMKERIQELEKNKLEAEQLKQEKERIKDEAESLENAALKQYREVEEAEKEIKAKLEAESNQSEAEEIFRKFDSNQDGVVDVSELQTRSTFDKDRDGQVSEEEAKFFLGESSQLPLMDFVERAWPLIKPYLMIEGGMFKPPVPSEADDMVEDGEEPHEDDEDHHEDLEPSEGEEDHGADGHEDQEHDGDDGDADDHHEEPAADPRYDEETQRLVDLATQARSQYTSAERSVRDIDVEIEKIKESLGVDYGPQEEFATLAGQCLEYTDREYLYKLCPFDRATQQPKNGGSETRLGTWGEWVGEGNNRYDAMLYTQGAACWNGPNRSARANVHCGLDSRITSVSEPNRCEYVFEMHTPAACVETEVDTNHRASSHDEL